MLMTIINKAEGLRDVIWYIIIGILSGTIKMGGKEHKQKNRYEKFVVWLTSFCFAVFVTPSVIWIIENLSGLNVPSSVGYGVCFFTSQFGERLLIVSINIYRSLDWKTIILSIMNKKNNNEN